MTRRGWLEWSDFTAQRVFRIQGGLRLPLERVSFLDGDGGSGRTATYFLPCEHGLLTSRRGVLSLHSHDLADELWRVPINGWSSTLIYDGSVVLVGPTEHGEVLQVTAANGSVLRRDHTSVGLIQGFTASTLLQGMHEELGKPRVRVVDRGSLRPLWERPGLGSCTSSDETYLVDDELATVLRRVDAATGRVLWTFEVVPPAERERAKAQGRGTSQIRSGFPSVVALTDTVIVVLDDCTVCSLDLESGRVIAKQRPPYPGINLVTETSVFFLQPFGLSEFDHRTMKEVSRIEYRKDVAPLYGKQDPYPCAFWLTDESVIWTNVDGTLMGVDRKQGTQRDRMTWVDRPRGALFPIAKFPLAHGDFLYAADMGENLGLYCYRSSAASKSAVGSQARAEERSSMEKARSRGARNVPSAPGSRPKK